MSPTSPPVPPRRYTSVPAPDDRILTASSGNRLSADVTDKAPPVPALPPPCDDDDDVQRQNTVAATSDACATNGVDDVGASRDVAAALTTTTTVAATRDEVDFDPYSLHADHVFQVRRDGAAVDARVNVAQVLTPILSPLSISLLLNTFASL